MFIQFYVRAFILATTINSMMPDPKSQSAGGIGASFVTRLKLRPASSMPLKEAVTPINIGILRSKLPLTLYKPDLSDVRVNHCSVIRPLVIVRY